MVSPLLDEDKMTINPGVRDRKKVESEIITKLGPQWNWLKKISPKTKKASSPKAKTMKNCKANEIINLTTGKCMRITTMIKQIVKKNKLALAENDIERFIDAAKVRKLPLGSEREITAALNILINSGVFKTK
jgi:hypothetical protein